MATSNKNTNSDQNTTQKNAKKFHTPEPELQDLETSLQALENLDRASPDLWPDQSKLNRNMALKELQLKRFFLF